MSFGSHHAPHDQDVWLALLQSRLDMGRFSASGAERLEHIRACDAELARIEIALFAVRRSRNTLAAACNLPAEILSHVFSFARAVWPPSCTSNQDEGYEILLYDLGWIRLTHVCSLWREVALGTPSLWAKVDECFEIPKAMVSLIQERIKTCPLSLTFDHDLTWRTYEPDVEAILSAWATDTVFAQLQSLRFLSFRSEDLESAWDYLKLPIRSLTTLTLTIDDEDAQRVMELPNDICALIQSFNLRELCLEDCILSWSLSFSPATLTRLDIVCYYFAENDVLPTFQQLATLLTSLRSLQYLKLRDMFPKDNPIHVHNPIVLQPGLKVMSYGVCNSLDAGLAFLSRLVLPPSSTMYIDISEYSHDLATTPEVLATTMLNLYRVGGSDPQPIELIIHGSLILLGRSERERCAWSTTFPPPMVYSSLGTDSHIPGQTIARMPSYYYRDDAGNLQERRIGDHIFTVSLRNLRAIALDHCALQEIASNNLIAKLVDAHGVRRLGLDLPGSGPLFTGLREKMHETYRIFPLLEIIHLHPKRRDHKSVLQTDLEGECRSDLLSLAALLKDRRESGVPLREIAVEKGFAEWPIWDTIRQEVVITVLDF